MSISAFLGFSFFSFSAIQKKSLNSNIFHFPKKTYKIDNGKQKIAQRLMKIEK